MAAVAQRSMPLQTGTAQICARPDPFQQALIVCPPGFQGKEGYTQTPTCFPSTSLWGCGNQRLWITSSHHHIIMLARKPLASLDLQASWSTVASPETVMCFSTKTICSSSCHLPELVSLFSCLSIAHCLGSHCYADVSSCSLLRYPLCGLSVENCQF